MTLEDEIFEYCELYDRPNLECDGATRVFSWILRKKNVPHTIMGGRLEYRDAEIDEPYIVEPHFWIETEQGSIIDFKARMWLPGKDGVPHGVFRAEDYPNVLYVGEEAKMLVCESVFNVLTKGDENEQD